MVALSLISNLPRVPHLPVLLKCKPYKLITQLQPLRLSCTNLRAIVLVLCYVDLTIELPARLRPRCKPNLMFPQNLSTHFFMSFWLLRRSQPLLSQTQSVPSFSRLRPCSPHYLIAPALPAALLLLCWLLTSLPLLLTMGALQPRRLRWLLTNLPLLLTMGHLRPRHLRWLLTSLSLLLTMGDLQPCHHLLPLLGQALHT